MSAKNAAKIDTLSFEDALVELETIVRSLETGEAALEDSITAYERGVQLKTHCEKKLRDAQAKIEKISISSDGKTKKQPLDPEE
ncbi:MAG: exodeoxyribonuclease VII small subunit [Alphaproteobacteria bacterium]|nr:exodeoxyribonuclease VII small subunit [Alphaproteobacteria bacterium]